MELFKASNQWATRPADERFNSLTELYEATKGYADIARESSVKYSDIRVEADGSEVRVAGKQGRFARLTNWAFGQLSTIAKAPAGYLRELPATLACQNLNHGLKQRVDASTEGRLLFHDNGELLLRCAVSDRYSRIWNYEIANRLLPLEQHGWYAPVAYAREDDKARTRLATPADIRSSSASWLKEGTPISPAGLYASDHDLFAFLVNDSARVNDGSKDGISQGIIVENSEVGASRFRLTAFGLQHVCGNHIIWGASNVREIAIRHIGNTDRWGRQLEIEFKRFSNESVAGLELQIAKAKKYVIAQTKDEVLDTLFKKLAIPRAALDASYELAEKHETEQQCAPNTAWGILQGLTRYSQTLKHTDTRTELDKKAGKILEIAF